jgi:predicted GNAT family acetyltransferase
MSTSQTTVGSGGALAPVVTLDDEHHRYEIAVDGRRIGLIDFRQRGDVLDFDHTEIDPALEGRGLGATLVRGALDDVRARGLTVNPWCSFVRVFIARNPEYADLVAH